MIPVYTTYNDRELIQFLKDDDQEAFREIYDRYWKRILFKAVKKVNDISLAEEVVQDVFLSIWNRRHGLMIEGDLGTYLAAAVFYNVVRARCRKRRELEVHCEAMSGRSGTENTTENMLAFKILNDDIVRYVSALPTQTRLVYRLHKEEGRSYREIASYLNISPKTVDYHISKAVKGLRATLSSLFSAIGFIF